MRISGFLVGGIVGAAAAMYFSRNNGRISTANWNQAVEKAGQFIRTAKNMWDSTSAIQTSGQNEQQSIHTQ